MLPTQRRSRLGNSVAILVALLDHAAHRRRERLGITRGLELTEPILGNHPPQSGEVSGSNRHAGLSSREQLDRKRHLMIDRPVGACDEPNPRFAEFISERIWRDRWEHVDTCVTERFDRRLVTATADDQIDAVDECRTRRSGEEIAFLIDSTTVARGTRGGRTTPTRVSGVPNDAYVTKAAIGAKLDRQFVAARHHHRRLPSETPLAAPVEPGPTHSGRPTPPRPVRHL